MIVDPFVAITAAISAAKQRVVVVSAFAKHDACDALFSFIPSDGIPDRRLYLRWQKRDLLIGASDFSVYDAAKKFGFNVYLQLTLHAKVYVADARMFVGSANLTASGLGLRAADSNFEIVVDGICENDFEQWLFRLHQQSIELTDDLYARLRLEVEQEDNSAAVRGASWSSEIQELLGANSDHTQVTLYDFFWLPHPAELFVAPDDLNFLAAQHDKSILKIGRDCSHRELREKFLDSPAWVWLATEAKVPTRFGALSEALHSHVKTHPNPFRRDVKIALQNLISWGEALVPERCIVSQPNRSQVIQII